MADFGSPVAQNVNVNPQQGIQTLSGLLGLQQQKLALQTGQALKSSAESEALEKGVEATGKVEASGFLKNLDFFKHFGSDGTLDTNSVFQDPGFAKLSGPAKETAANAVLGIKNNQIKNKSDLASLQGSVVAGASRLIGALANDPDVQAGNEKGFAKTNAQWDIVREMYPDQGAAFAEKFQPHQTPENMKNPGDLANAVRSVQMMGEDVASTQAQQNPVLGSQVGPNGEMVGTAQNRVSGAMNTAPGSIPLGLSPTQMAQPVTLPNGQVTTWGALFGGRGGAQGGAPPAPGPVRTAAPGQAPSKAASSPFLAANGHPRTAQEDAPPPNAPRQVQEQFAASAKAASEYVDQVRTTDEQYGTNMAVNTAIRNLLKGGVATGPGTQKWHEFFGAMGSPGGLDNVADYQQLGAWLDRQAAGMRGPLGLPNTNAGQQASETISGSTGYQPKAIEAKNNFNQALVEGLHQQRQGLDRVAGYSGNPSPSAVGAYRAAWANNFDPIVHEYKAAKKRGDKDAVSELLATLTPQQAAALAKKGKNLDRLEKAQAPE